ncbi:MAG TPA: hypothetical protein VM308_06420 [Sphingomicrobium sp.]|nr:hypothetical protein [Sphingomicrobium sp.]
MARIALILALGTIASAASAASLQPMANPAPPGGPDTRYCLKVGPLTGNLAETILCLTRAEWAEQDVDVDAEWARNGVRVLG